MKLTNIGLLSFVNLLILMIPSLALSQNSFDNLRIEINTFMKPPNKCLGVNEHNLYCQKTIQKIE